MAREPTGESIMPTRQEVAALLAEHDVVEAPHASSQPLGTIGLLVQMADPAPPPLSCWGWLGRNPVGARIGFDYIERMPDEHLDAFRLRISYSHGGPGVVAHYSYARGTK